MAYEYETVDSADLLRLARERFHALEMDHARLSMTNEPGRDERLQEFEDEIERTKQRVAELEAETGTSARKPSDVPVDPEEVDPPEET